MNFSLLGDDCGVQAGGQLGLQMAEDQQVQQGRVRHQCPGQAPQQHRERPAEVWDCVQEQGHEQDLKSCDASILYCILYFSSCQIKSY